MCAKRRALVVGIDKYKNFPALGAAVKDAKAMKKLLARNEDGSPNYECELWAGETRDRKQITRSRLRRGIVELFENFDGDVLFYFAGHGSIGALGGHLVTHDGATDDWGVAMDEVFRIATHSDAHDILIILDCCHAGDLADLHYLPMAAGSRTISAVREGMTVMAAAMPQGLSYERDGHGRFTTAVMRALEGSAADPMGWVTAPSIFASVERSFGAGLQKPIFKSYASQTTIVRRTAPAVDPQKLRALPTIFKKESHRRKLDPEYEPAKERGENEDRDNPKKIAMMELLRDFRAAGLIKSSTPGEHLYYTAMRSHRVELTPRGKEFWRLANDGEL